MIENNIAAFLVLLLWYPKVQYNLNVKDDKKFVEFLIDSNP